MESSTQSLPDTQSLSEFEKGDLSHEKAEADNSSDCRHEDETQQDLENASASKKEETSASAINFSDWNGDDDPDNPYNCMISS
jgi:hypothetical protein